MFCSANYPEIIQLVEVDAPPPTKPSMPCSSASRSSWSSSDCTDEEDTELEEQQGEDYCESYCSSDDEDEVPDPNDPSMSRVLAWRSSFDSVYGTDDGEYKVLFHIFYC